MTTYGHQNGQEPPDPRYGPAHPYQSGPNADEYPTAQQPAVRQPYRRPDEAAHNDQTARFDRTVGYGRPSRHDGRYSDGDQEYEPQRRNTRVMIIVATSVMLVLGLGAAAWAVLKPNPGNDPLVASTGPNVGIGAGTTTSDVAATTVTTPSPTPTKPRPTATKPRPKPTPSRKPPAAQLPPPPPPAIEEAPSCTTYVGTKATPSQVGEALRTAGSIQYWSGVTPPAGSTGPLPPITVPTELMRAIAFTESSWVSNVIACDGGIGTMQVMPGTASYINQRFGTNYDVHTLSGNTRLGAAYVEWLTVYFGLYYFGTYDLDATAPIATDGSQLRLKDAVIAAYNVGPAALEDDHGTADGSDDTLSIPNQWYVNRVLGYVANCPCDDL